MGKRAMKNPGVTGGEDKGHTKRSPLGPTKGGALDMQVDDASTAELRAGSLRPKHGAGIGLGDASALGIKGTRGRSATNASAQFRITAKRTPMSEGPYPGTLAQGRVLPSVMGSRQNFLSAGRYGSMRG